MKPEDLNILVDRVKEEIVAAPQAAKIAIVGATPTTLNLLAALQSMGLLDRVSGIYASSAAESFNSVHIKPTSQLRADTPAIVVVASDEGKEQLLSEAVPYLSAQAKLLIAGYSHFEFVDPVFLEETRSALIPSLANGYPNSLIHIYQCLRNAARLNLDGIVAEFGMFKGGTTMLMSRFIERLGAHWRVYGFDSFTGFPARRSPLDMYAHPDCVFLDEALVRRMFQGRNVEIIAGDIVQTIDQIKNRPIVLAFVDTDNFTSAKTVLDIVRDQVVPGGAIVFDHFTGQNRFLYTLGERIAAKALLDDVRFFNLHDTGVFLRQR